MKQPVPQTPKPDPVLSSMVRTPGSDAKLAFPLVVEGGFAGPAVVP
jgi:hypothetical protein